MTPPTTASCSPSASASEHLGDLRPAQLRGPTVRRSASVIGQAFTCRGPARAVPAPGQRGPGSLPRACGSGCVLLAIGTFVIAAASIGSVTGTLAQRPRRSVYDLAEAIEFVADRLPRRSLQSSSYDDVDAVLGAHCDYLTAKGVASAKAADDIGEDLVVVADDEPVAWILGRLDELGRRDRRRAASWRCSRSNSSTTRRSGSSVPVSATPTTVRGLRPRRTDRGHGSVAGGM